MRLSGPSMLVTKLAEQALRPKRIDSLTLPMATFGGPLIAGVRLLKKSPAASFANIHKFDKC